MQLREGSFTDSLHMEEGKKSREEKGRFKFHRTADWKFTQNTKRRGMSDRRCSLHKRMEKVSRCF